MDDDKKRRLKAELMKYKMYKQNPEKFAYLKDEIDFDTLKLLMQNNTVEEVPVETIDVEYTEVVEQSTASRFLMEYEDLWCFDYEPDWWFDDELIHKMHAQQMICDVDMFKDIIESLNMFFKDRFDLTKHYVGNSTFNLVIYFPQTNMKNKNGLTYLNKHIFNKIGIMLDDKFRLFGALKGAKARYTAAEYIHGYRHSHLTSDRDFSFSSFCMGQSALSKKIQYHTRYGFKSVQLFKFFCVQLLNHMEYESLEGRPHKFMEKVFELPVNTEAVSDISVKELSKHIKHFVDLELLAFEFNSSDYTVTFSSLKEAVNKDKLILLNIPDEHKRNVLKVSINGISVSTDINSIELLKNRYYDCVPDTKIVEKGIYKEETYFEFKGKTVYKVVDFPTILDKPIDEIQKYVDSIKELSIAENFYVKLKNILDARLKQGYKKWQHRRAISKSYSSNSSRSTETSRKIVSEIL